jgi:hypothetical protein
MFSHPLFLLPFQSREGEKGGEIFFDIMITKLWNVDIRALDGFVHSPARGTLSIEKRVPLICYSRWGIHNKK